ncbi:unnamed protein product [Lathyrus sativus]|nr:unnamed protein product [Lathyrus sativus]
MNDSSKSEYEALRNARMSENKARFESLGILNSVSKLREISALINKKRPYVKKDYGVTPVRRSQRIKNVADGTTTADNHQRSYSSFSYNVTPKQDLGEEGKRPANAPFVELNPKSVELFFLQETYARRCEYKGRGRCYSSFLGISCHFCGVKKLCGEEDCKRCGNCDVNEPCLGKTDCSVCHSRRGVFCRACLKIRYGEEIEEVRENKEWMCPHCIEEKGINPYWICNSSKCMRKQNLQPTELAMHKAREMGYESVAHLFMEQLKGGNYPKLDKSL